MPLWHKSEWLQQWHQKLTTDYRKKYSESNLRKKKWRSKNIAAEKKKRRLLWLQSETKYCVASEMMCFSVLVFFFWPITGIHVMLPLPRYFILLGQFITGVHYWSNLSRSNRTQNRHRKENWHFSGKVRPIC